MSGPAYASSTGHSSPEEYDDDSTSMQESQWQAQNQSNRDGQPSSSMEDSQASSGRNAKMPPPTQKRRRVTRACDECRRKKIKCDGKQPCTHCTVYSYECTFDQPSNRRRNPAPQYIEAIESRLHRAELLLKRVIPDINLDDPTYESDVPQRMHPSDAAAFHTRVTAPSGSSDPQLKLEDGEAEKESLLESMVENTGALDLDDQGHWDFHGHSSGLVFLRRMREQFGDLMGEAEGYGSPFLKTSPMSQVFDSPRSPIDSPADAGLDLPSRECARGLCNNTLDEASAVMRFVHQPSFYASFDRVYDTSPDRYGNEENKFIPLLYAVMAVGCLFSKNENSKLHLGGYATAADHGFKYFRSSRHYMDITDCRDLTSLQTIMFMILFLQCSAKLATCYSYIGIALRSAIRMGMHRSIKRNFNPIEMETRKRMFWTIRKMDIYVGALLGYPIMLSEDDIDQDHPEEVDDEFITAEKILPMPAGKVSIITATNAHSYLLKIMQKVVKFIYPLKGLNSNNSINKSHQSYVVSHAKIREIERDLQEWMENLPMALRPGGEEVTEQIARVQQLLRMAYAHVQMILYRPFLHYVSQFSQRESADKRSYACAAACVSVSRNIIHITAEMKKRGMLNGAYWFTMYTTFFAILSLVFFVLENPESPASKDIYKEAMEGKDTLASLAKRSMAADRCTVTLARLFDQLPEKVRRGRVGSASSSKKRHAPSPIPHSRMQVQHSSPHIPPSSKPDVNGIQRAGTFPKHNSPAAWKRASVPYDNSNLMPRAETIFRRGSHDPFTPTSSDAIGHRTPDSSSSSLSFNPQQPGLQQNYSGTGLPDLSAMMFPSADPFAYPNQPMTTLENHQIKSDNSFDPNIYNNTTSSTYSDSYPYDNSDVQLLGPLPPYLMQGQQPGLAIDIQRMGGTPDLGGVVPEGHQMPLSGATDDDWQAQTSRNGLPPGMNMDEIFGQEWKGGWMEQGFRQ